MALETELQEFIALALGVVDGQIRFGLPIRGTDDVGGLVDKAL